MKFITAITLPALMLGLFSCGNNRKITREYTTLDTLTVSSTTSDYRAARPRYWDITHTRAILSFNMLEKTANGEAWIQLHPYAYPADSLILDAKSMAVNEVRLITEAHEQKIDFSWENDKLRLKFPRSYRKEDTVKLYIKYKAMPYAAPTGGSAAITDDRGLYFINTDNGVPNKPSQIWTQGETESNSHWLPSIDQPNERLTTEISLIVPDSFVTLSNGSMVGSKKLSNGLRQDYWQMDKPIQTYAIMFAIGNFTVIKDRSWNNKEISYYVEPEFAPYAKKIFNNTPEMVDYFSKVTGVPYAWNKYSQVIVRDYVSGAMENTTASLFGEFMNQDFREIADNNFEDIVSHELFHQWFGDYVTAESWSNLTVNESFANYGEQLWRLHKYGRASNDELAYNDLGKYLSAANYDDPALVRYYYTNREDMFDRVSYEKGGATLHYLHGLLGDTVFYKAMNIYLTRNALHPAEASDWRKAVEEASGLDWNWFFNQWYYRAGHPALKIDYNYDDAKQQLMVNVAQVQSDSNYTYKLPLKAALAFGNSLTIIEWNIQKKKQTYTFKYENGKRPLFIPDMTHWLVGDIKENKQPREWLQQFNATGEDYINKRKAVSGAFLAQNDTTSQTIFHLALKDGIPGIRRYTLTLLERIPDKYKWRDYFKNEIAMLAVNDGNNKVRAAAFSVLGKWKDRSAETEMKQALSDSSYMVSGAALKALYEISKDTAYHAAKRILNGKPRSDLRSNAWYILAYEGRSEDINIFKERAPYVYGKDKMELSGYLYTYSLSVKDDAVFEKCLQLIASLAAAENIKGYRSAIGINILSAYAYYERQETKEKDKVKLATAQKRKAIALKYRQQILAEEKDPEVLKDYKEITEG